MDVGRYVCAMAEPQHTITRTRSHPGLSLGLHFGGRRMRIVGLAVGAVLALGACSGESDAASVPTIHLEPTTLTTVAPTTTSTEATTTTEDPEAAYERDVAEITAVYDQLLSYLGEYGAVVNEEALEVTAIDPLLTRWMANTEAWETEGYLISGTAYNFRIIELEIQEHEATLETCEFDGGQLLTADGSQVIIPVDTEHFLWTTHLRRTAGGWRVFETNYAGGEPTPCDA